jgi:hypothetical protein
MRHVVDKLDLGRPAFQLASQSADESRNSSQRNADCFEGSARMHIS